MAAPTEVDIEYTREDAHPIGFQLLDENDVAEDISTGYDFTMTLNTSPDGNEAGATILWALTASIIDGPNGVFQFLPSSVQSDIVADVYFFDVQQNTPTKRTVAKGQFTMLPQITLT